jgi:hypothetical protein
MPTYYGDKITVSFVRSNELQDVFFVHTNAGFSDYVTFPRSSCHSCESVAAFY